MNALKVCVVIVADLISEIGVIMEDKKVNFAEIIGLAPELLKIPKFVSNLPNALDELKNGISDEYLAEIKNDVAAKLDLKNDKVEKIVESCVNWIVVTSSTVFEIRKAVKG